MIQWVLVLNGFLSLFLLGLCDNIRGPIFPQLLTEFGLTDTKGSWFFAFASGATLIGSYSVGWLAKVKRTRIPMPGEEEHGISTLSQLKFFQLVMGLSMGGMVLCTTYPQLLAMAILFGVCLGALGVLQSGLVSEGTPLHLRPQMLSALHSMYGLASFTAPLFVRYFVDWKPATGWLAAVCIGASLLVVFVKYKPKFPLPNSVTVAPLGDLLRQQDRVSWWGPTVLSLYVVAELAMSSRLALVLQRSYEYSIEKSSFWVSAFFVCLLSGRIVFIIYRSSPRRLTAIVGYSLTMAIVSFIAGLFLHPGFLVLTGLFMAPVYPLYISRLSELYHGKVLNIAMAKSLSLQAIFVVLMHIGLGFLSDLVGLRWALLIGPGALILALGCMIYFESRLQLALMGDRQ